MAKNTFRQKRGAKKRNQTKKQNQAKKMRAKKMQRGGAHNLYKMYYAVNKDNSEAIKIMFENDIPRADDISIADFNKFLYEKSMTFIAIYIKTDPTTPENQVKFAEVENEILSMLQTHDPQQFIEKIPYQNETNESITGEILYITTGNPEVSFGMLTEGYNVPIIEDGKNGICVSTMKIPSRTKTPIDITPIEIGIELPPVKESVIRFEKMDANRRLNIRDAEAAKAAELERQRIEQQKSDEDKRQRNEETRLREEPINKQCESIMRKAYEEIKKSVSVSTEYFPNGLSQPGPYIIEKFKGKIVKPSGFVKKLMEYDTKNFKYDGYSQCYIRDDVEWFEKFLNEDREYLFNLQDSSSSNSKESTNSVDDKQSLPSLLLEESLKEIDENEEKDVFNHLRKRNGARDGARDLRKQESNKRRAPFLERYKTP